MFTAAIMVAAVISGMIVLYGIQQFLERSRAEAPGPKAGGLNEADLHNRMIAKHNQIRQLTAALSQRDHITVSDLMTSQLTAVSQETSISEIRELMGSNRTRHLLVQDENKLLIGIISDRDLTKRTRGRASDFMTRDPATVTPGCPISDAVALVLGKRVSCLPVVDGGHLRGVMTSTDLLVILECLLEDYEKSAHDAGRRSEAAVALESTISEPAEEDTVEAQPVA